MVCPYASCIVGCNIHSSGARAGTDPVDGDDSWLHMIVMVKRGGGSDCVCVKQILVVKTRFN